MPAAILFLGPGNTPASTFALGFFTVPAVMDFMPAGSFFGGLWFGLLFLAAVTSSISMLQPAIAFLEDGFGLKRRASVALLGVVTLIGAALVMWFSANAQALTFADFSCEFMMILAALFQVVIFGWVYGAEKGFEETNRGADFRVPRFMPFVVRFVTPIFLLVVLSLWCFYEGPDKLEQMSPGEQAEIAEEAAYANRDVYSEAIGAYLSEQLGAQVEGVALEVRVTELLGVEEGVPEDLGALPTQLWEVVERTVESRVASARKNANVARFTFVGVLLVFLAVFVLSDIACRGRVRRMLEQHEAAGSLPEDG